MPRAMYLAIRPGERRKMIYVSEASEEIVRRGNATGREVDGLLETISQECLRTFLAKRKEKPS
jgi:hypothetical protein